MSKSVTPVDEALIEAVGGRSVIVVPNNGNAGDSLINHSVYSLLRELAIEFEYIHPKDIKKENIDSDRCYLVMVNGALVGNRNIMDDVVSIINGNAEMVLFSATISGRAELLRSLVPSTRVVCREPVSYKHVMDNSENIIVTLSEDCTMAIADGNALLPVKNGIAYYSYIFRVIIKSIYKKYPLRLLFNVNGCMREDSAGAKYLSAYRVDGERSDVAIPFDNIDLSLMFSTRNVSPAGAEAAAYGLINVLRRSKYIKTNRLHVSIACCLAGVKCDVSANSYYKVKSIYDFSLKDRYRNLISWM